MDNEMDGRAGEQISDAAKRAIALARIDGEPIVLVFNDQRIVVEAHSTVEEVVTAYNAACEESRKAYMAPERVAEREQQAQIAEEKRHREFAALVETVKVADEKQLRESPDPWPCTEEELRVYIKALHLRRHDYGTCCYAMSLAAVAAFNYIAHALGTTGFQSSCADLDILRRTRGLKHGFQILDFDKLLYPQSCNEDNFPSAAFLLRKHHVDLARQAQEKLTDSEGAHPNVIAHWKRLAAAG